MNVDPPDALIAIRPTSTLGSTLGRVFMLSGKLPHDIAKHVERLDDGLWNHVAEGDDRRASGSDGASERR